MFKKIEIKSKLNKIKKLSGLSKIKVNQVDSFKEVLLLAKSCFKDLFLLDLEKLH